MKKGIWVIGIDDMPFDRGDGSVGIVGVAMRNGRIERVMSSRISKDGDDSASRIIGMVGRHYSKQGKAVMIHSITLGGLNIVDIGEVAEKLGCPVVCITERKADRGMLASVLGWKFPHRKQLLKEVHRIGKYYVSFVNTTLGEVELLVEIVGMEPVRIAHLIGKGISHG